MRFYRRSRIEQATDDVLRITAGTLYEDESRFYTEMRIKEYMARGMAEHTAFMTFLAVQFGEGIPARLPRNPSLTFAGALTEETKPLTCNQLFERLRAWPEGGAVR